MHQQVKVPPQATVLQVRPAEQVGGPPPHLFRGASSLLILQPAGAVTKWIVTTSGNMVNCQYSCTLTRNIGHGPVAV